MSTSSLKPEILISRLSHRPCHLIGAMITISDPPKPRALADRLWTHRVSSLGILDRLPPEIMWMFLDLLDIQSIARFAMVSSRGNTVVRSHRPYRDLVTFAPHVLAAFGRTGLNGLHSVAELYAALQTERCAKCKEYGAFLFLPTCERCCWECLLCNPSLRMVTPKEAKRYFGLSERYLHRLPTLSVIPGNYGICGDPAPDPCKLVSVKAARSLGLMVHGSAEKLAQAMARRCKSTLALIVGRYLQGEPAVAQDQDLLLMPCQGNIPTDNFFGMASIPFPSLSRSGRVEDGLWCKGCEVTVREHDRGRLPGDVLAAVVPPDCGPNRVLVGLERRARSRESFLEHIKHCYGARKLVAELKTGNS